MPENDKTAANDATDLKALLATVNELAKNQKIMADTMAADAESRKTAQTAAETKAAADAAAAKDGAGKEQNTEAGKPLTAAEIEALVNERAGKLLDERFSAQQTAQEKSAAREKYLGEKMKDLPALYRSQLKGDDPEQWKVQEQSIREQAKADAAAMGFVAKDVGGNQAGAGQGQGGAGSGAATGGFLKMAGTASA